MAFPLSLEWAVIKQVTVFSERIACAVFCQCTSCSCNV